MITDPRDEHPFTIVHTGTGDEAQADTWQAAHVAQAQLVRDAGYGRANIILRSTKEKA